ncbi:MAG: glycosyltransferase family 2 protein [Actinomycetota bacterium]
MNGSPIPTITPVDQTDRPLWSVMIPVHNCADLLRHALGSALDDLAGRDDIEIEVVDDNSSDDPAAVVAAFDSPFVHYHRLAEPAGAIGNFNRCLERSRGRLVHLLHGDDGVRPGFYAAMEQALARDDVGAAVCRVEYIDADGAPGAITRSEVEGSGRWTDALHTLGVSNRVRPAGIAARRSQYESIGGFHTGLPHAADWDMWVRLAASTTVWFEDAVLAEYRAHDANHTSQLVATGDNIRERIVAIDVVGAHLPAADRGRVRREALRYSAVFAGRTAIQCLRRRQASAALRQGVQAAHCLWRSALPGGFVSD